jgi:phage tail-like protein
MDANGTRFHLLLGTRDWLERTDAGRLSPSDITGVEWSDTRQELTLVQLAFRYQSAKNDRAPSLANRRGAGRDRYGNWYWLSTSADTILVRSSGTGVTSRFWRLGDGTACPVRSARRGEFGPLTAAPAIEPLGLRGLAITDDHYLVVGVADPGGLLIFDLHAGGPPQLLCWPADLDLAPFDMASRRGGGVWILDRDNRQIWQLDRRFAIVRHSPAVASAPASGRFHDLDGAAAVNEVLDPLAPLSAADAWPAPADAVSIERGAGDDVFVLAAAAAAFSITYFYRTIDAAPQVFDLAPFGLAGHDLAFVPTPPDPRATTIGRLFVVEREGNQSFAFDVAGVAGGGVTMQRVPQYFPMQVFGGKALVTAGGQAYYDFEQAWVPLVDQKRPRHAERGEVRIEPLDGREPDCVWHRLLLDACIPPETNVAVWCRAANTLDDLPRADWSPEPRPYRRRSGSELPFTPASEGLGAGTWETLIQAARGRYLELRLELSGNGRSTPRIHAMRVYYPRFSYLTHYLPAVYREDASSASFLERYLANTEGLLTTIEDRIAAAQALLDIRSTPPEALDWLASWLGLVLDPLWDDRKRRLLITHAMAFFARRGTVQGLQMALALTLFDCATAELFTGAALPNGPAASIRIVEKFRTRQAAPVVLGDPTATSGPRIGVQQNNWTPPRGRDALRDRYIAALTTAGISTSGVTAFPLATPSGDAAPIWRAVSGDALGFVPGITAAPPSVWREFLARRYHGVSAFNEVYGRTGHANISAFDNLELPTTAPPDGAPLVDWYEFETIVLATAAVAHRFSVLLPMRPSATADSAEHQVRLELARRIVALEKPAHTTFDVRFYWSLFRIGEARLGRDTLIDRGSRAPDLMTPAVLGRDHLGETYLAPSHPQNISARRLVVGRGGLDEQSC